MEYDIVVAGGSVSGLLCAREVARSGGSVLVLEQDNEIGTPQHCGGMLSYRALKSLGIIPSTRIAGNRVSSARLVSPFGNSVTVPTNGDVLEVDRRALDKYVAAQAQKSGAVIQAGVTFRGICDSTVKSSMGDIRCRVAVDARGASILAPSQDMLISTQYEVQADWITRGQAVVMLDHDRYPGFFAWVIPSESGRGKVGVAGRRINSRTEMESLLARLGGGSVLRRITAPIWIGGPIERFVRDNVVTIGDAAGQSKPTTGGGIYSSGMGGVLAGVAISRYLETGDRQDLDYRPAWMGIFGREFEAQRTARRILENIDNTAIDSIIKTVRPQDMKAYGDFDFHTDSILALLGVRNAVRMAGAITSSEVRRLMGRAGIGT